MTPAVVIPTRLDSSRLPGKALLPVDGVPMLSFLLSRTQGPWSRVLAISEDEVSDPIEDCARRWNMPYMRGSHTDVLSRVLEAARMVSADIVVRVTHDNPLLDARGIRAGLEAFRNTGEPCVSNHHFEGRSDPFGYFVDMASVGALSGLKDVSEGKLEHVTLTLKEAGKADYFSVLDGDQSGQRWTVDTPDDYRRVGRLISHLPARDASAEEVATVYRRLYRGDTD